MYLHSYVDILYIKIGDSDWHTEEISLSISVSGSLLATPEALIHGLLPPVVKSLSDDT